MSGRPNQNDASKPGALKRISAIARRPYTQGLPEWELFPDEASRTRAIEDIERGMMPRSFAGWAWFIIICGSLSLGPFIVLNLVINQLAPNMRHGETIAVIGALLVYTVIIYVLTRRDIPRDLRKRLQECGVPMCLRCGHCLRGLPAGRTTCPECGRPLNAKARSLLASPDDPAKTED